MTTLISRAIPATRRASALYCTTHGRGTPLLLLHGFGLDGAMFGPLVPALAARYHVIVPDLRGHGQSQRLPGSDSVARHADDVEDLLDLLGVRSCFVLGYGTGGAIAQQLAYEHPARLRGIVLVNAYVHTTTLLSAQIGGRLRVRLPQLALLGNGHRADGAPVPVEEQTPLPFDSRRWLGEVRCPALVLAGADDLVLARQARDLARRLPQAELRMIEGADQRLLTPARRDQVLDAVLPWLDTHKVAA